MKCPYCGSESVDYIGVTDGGGAFGTSLCDEWHCVSCGEYLEYNCVDVEPED